MATDSVEIRAWFEELIRANYQWLYVKAWQIVRNSADAEDVIQAAVLKAFENLALLKSRDAALKWLASIVRNSALDLLKRGGQARRRMVVDDQAIEEVEAATSRPPETSDLMETLIAEIDQLPDRYRQALLMRHMEDLDIPAIAQRLGISPNNVRVRLFRAYERLRLSRPLIGAVGLE